MHYGIKISKKILIIIVIHIDHCSSCVLHSEKSGPNFRCTLKDSGTLVAWRPVRRLAPCQSNSVWGWNEEQMRGPLTWWNASDQLCKISLSSDSFSFPLPCKVRHSEEQFINSQLIFWLQFQNWHKIKSVLSAVGYKNYHLSLGSPSRLPINLPAAAFQCWLPIFLALQKDLEMETEGFSLKSDFTAQKDMHRSSWLKWFPLLVQSIFWKVLIGTFYLIPRTPNYWGHTMCESRRWCQQSLLLKKR